MTNIVKSQTEKLAKEMAYATDMRALGNEPLWYVRSTGEIIGPFWGKKTSKKNTPRAEFGNLFDNERDAKRAAKYIKLVLRFLRWLP